MNRPRLHLGKVPIDVVDFAEAIDAIDRLIQSRTGGFVLTPNVDHVVGVEKNPAFEHAYSRASLSLADGMPLVWASKLLGQPLPERVSGSDVCGPLLERAGQKGWRVYLFGAGPGVAQKAAEVVKERWGTNVVGVDNPMVDPNDASQVDRIAAQLAATRPDLILVALGAPKQEILIDRMAERLKPAVLLGIGASLDFIAGTVKRAPVFMQRAGLEWAYRLSQEPGRLWRRYLVEDPKFVAILLRTLREKRRSA
ncbi:MAG: WecB/TagA/CpsF family glycosyltransferase [Archangiaceae bacterium]|nr:WecB/TagA/CpsF family glycosyltransferase [Archangiaceae bacterium]